MTTRMDEAVDVGTTKRLVHVFERFDPLLTPFDPQQVQLRTKAPDGTESSWPVRKISVGRYQTDVVVGLSGQWVYRWQGDDPQYSEQGSFVVRRSLYGEFLPETPEPGPFADPPYTWDELAPYTWDDLVNLTWDELGGEGSSMSETYIYEQGTPLGEWTIVHNLNRYPAVTVEDQNGNPVLVAPNYDGPNQLTLTFNPPLQGVAYLN